MIVAPSPRPLRRGLLALAGLLVALLGVELVVRLAAPQDVGAAAGSLLRGPLTTPGDHPVRTEAGEVTVHVNAHGFVDEAWPGAGTPRVLVLGDSFVQAAQVNLAEGFGRQLESALRVAGSPEAEVISMGVPGAGTATALEVYRAYGRDLHPDVVLLGFLVANDVLNNHPLLEGKDDKPFYALRDGVLVRTDATEAVATGGLWRGSHAWRFLTRARTKQAIAARKLALGKGMPLDLRVHDPAPDPIWEEAWAVTDALVGALAGEVTADGARFATLLFPDGVTANDRDRQAMVARYPAARGWNLSRAQARAGTMAAKHGPVCDLLPALQGEPAYYLAKDGHWTAAGHAAAAQAAAGCGVLRARGGASE